MHYPGAGFTGRGYQPRERTRTTRSGVPCMESTFAALAKCLAV
jgi:hypothetical protein